LHLPSTATDTPVAEFPKPPSSVSVDDPPQPVRAYSLAQHGRCISVRQFPPVSRMMQCNMAVVNMEW